MPDHSQRPIIRMLSSRRQLLVVAVLISSFACLSAGEPIGWDVIPASAAEPVDSTSKSADATPVANPNRPTERQLKAQMGLAALVGIVIAGLALAALIVLWAQRLRRQFRRSLPDSDIPHRDFWFLKPPKPIVTKSSLPEAQQSPHDSKTDQE